MPRQFAHRRIGGWGKLRVRGGCQIATGTVTATAMVAAATASASVARWRWQVASQGIQTDVDEVRRLALVGSPLDRFSSLKDRPILPPCHRRRGREGGLGLGLGPGTGWVCGAHRCRAGQNCRASTGDLSEKRWSTASRRRLARATPPASSTASRRAPAGHAATRRTGLRSSRSSARALPARRSTRTTRAPDGHSSAPPGPAAQAPPRYAPPTTFANRNSIRPAPPPPRRRPKSPPGGVLPLSCPRPGRSLGGGWGKLPELLRS